MPYKLLFVCLGNICRSPAAENIMNHLIKQANLSDKIICDSAGTSSYHIGASPDSRMTSAAVRQNIPMKGKARQFTASDFAEFDLILAMDRENYRNILALDRQGNYRDKIKMMCDYATHHSEKEVPDPYYGGEKGFDRVLDLLLDACRGLLSEIEKKLV